MGSVCWKEQHAIVVEGNCQDPTRFYLHFAIENLEIPQFKQLILADFGSSYGRRSIDRMNQLAEYLEKSNKYRSKPLIIHNDLSTNNWSTFFHTLASNPSYFGLALGRSFYEQCLPEQSLSLGYSSGSLHHLSAKPCNILQHSYFEFANENEQNLFRKQARIDLEKFLQSRSRELQKGGVLILNIPCRNATDDLGFNRYFDLIYGIAGEILLPDELIDFTLPFYVRTKDECLDEHLFQRYSLKLIRLDFVRLQSSLFADYEAKKLTFEEFSQSLTTLMQTAIDSILKQILAHHQRTDEQIENLSRKCWILFQEKLREEIIPKEILVFSTFLILKKL